MIAATREIIRGLAGGTAFLVTWLILGMPWWLAGLLGAGLFVAASLLLSAPPPPASVSVAPGVTAQERDEFIAACSASTAALEQIARHLAEGDFRTRVQGLAQTTAQLTHYCQRKPESILAALALPRNLDHLLQMLRQYVELSQFPSPGATVAEALQKVQETVGNAALALEGMYEQLLDNDVAALQASATSLEYLLSADAGLERTRRNPPAGLAPDSSKSAALAANPAQRQMQNPL